MSVVPLAELPGKNTLLAPVGRPDRVKFTVPVKPFAGFTPTLI